MTGTKSKEKEDSKSSKGKTPRQLLKDAEGDWYRWAHGLKIHNLVKVIEYLAKAYYNGDAIVEDDVYDIILGVLEDRDPNNPVLDQVGAPITGENKVLLPYPMRSLDKVKPNTDVLLRRLKGYKGKVVISDKLDGISALLYNGADGLKLYTRGNGKEGQDITHLLPSLVTKKVLKNLPDGATIRGELIMPDHDFKKFSSEFKNARNLVAGLANSKTMDSKRKEILRYVHFVPYLMFHPAAKPTKQIATLKSWGFDTVWHREEDASKITEDYLIDLLERRKDKCPYTIDGLVVVMDVVEAPVKSGNPIHSFAFKNMLTQQIAETTVIDVLWRISKDGYIKPVIRVKEVELSGVTVSKATAFNAKWIMDNRIGPGAKVKLIRSGDVIPYIVDVTKKAKRAQMPAGEWEWGETGVDAIGTGKEWKREIALARNLYFFETLGVRGLGEGVIMKLYDAGFETFKQIISAKTSDFAKVDRMGATSAKKLRAAIDLSLKKLTWDRIMVASQQFGRSFGIRRIRAVLRAHPDVLTWDISKKEVAERIEQLNGFAEKTAKQFAAGLIAFKKFMTTMEKYLPKLEKPQKAKTGGKFTDMKIVFTGFRDKDLQEWVESEGGSVTGSVSKKTTLVVYRGESQAKVVKAQELGIKMITYEEFLKKHKRG